MGVLQLLDIIRLMLLNHGVQLRQLVSRVVQVNPLMLTFGFLVVRLSEAILGRKLFTLSLLVTFLLITVEIHE